jgi:hypothetical protein
VSSSIPEASAIVEIRYEDAKTARLILEAISPDNIKAPGGVSVESRAEGCTLKVLVSCSKGLGSLMATVDDLLACVQAAERAIEGVAINGK